MRHLMPLLAVAASLLTTAAASADLGDQLFKLLPDDGADLANSGAAYGFRLDQQTGLWAQPLQQQQAVTPPGGTPAPRSLTEAQQTATAGPAMFGDEVSPRIRTDAPPTAPAQSGLVWFTNQAEFEAFNQDEGNVLKGIEDYEESIQGPNDFEVFWDPLESGVSNLPDGYPFPAGMTGLPNLIVQSNIRGGAPTVPDPRGVNGLVTVADGALDAVSDVVVANQFVHSLDVIFTEEKSGVGFDTVTILGGLSVEVRVFSTDNVFLGMMPSPADPTGANFIGVWSPLPIGRINIFDPEDGAEGGDNIQAWEAPDPPSKLIWFNNNAEFEAFNQREGKVLKGTEEYEESILGPNDFDFFDDPLKSRVPNFPDGFPFPDGLTGLPNLRVQSNLSGGNPADEHPRGIMGLMALSDGYFGSASDVVVATFIVDSLDLIFTDGKSGVGFNPVTILGGPSVEVRVYSRTIVFLGMMTTPANASGTNFIGVWSPDTIGRINIFDPEGGLVGGDNIQAWGEVDPCPWDLDGNGVVGASDLLALLASWGPCKGCPADFDGNGTVGASDLLALLANWGVCP